MPRQRTLHRVTAMSIAVALLASIGLAGLGTVSPASAEEKYPSWSDVQKAKKNAKQKKAEVARIEEYLASLERRLQTAQDNAEKAGTAYQEAQTALDQAIQDASTLAASADAAQEEAQASTRTAGILATQLMQTAGGDTTLKLLMSGDSAEDMLYFLGTADQLNRQSAAIFESATADQKTAEALHDQAEVAEGVRHELADDAQQKFEAAQAAQLQVQGLITSNQAAYNKLVEQLAYLRDVDRETRAGYAEWQRKQKVKSGFDGKVSSSGWTRPVKGGAIASPFGSRVDPTYGTWAFHAGTDIGYLGCGPQIYAAHSGTVSYAGWYGGYGNAVIIDHGDGIQTLYGHQVDGGITVSVGQSVKAGQVIGHVGSTGKSTGCHLHYEVRQNGSPIDPVPFMRSNGITL